jgi:hypothetical protein
MYPNVEELAMAVNDVYEVTVDTVVKGEHCQNVLHYIETVGETDPIPAENLALGFVAAVEAAWLACLSDQSTLACVYVRRVEPAPGVAFTHIWNAVGTVADEPIPTTSAAIITWYTLTAGKRTRGRNYFAGTPESFQDGGLLEAAALALLATLADELSTPIVAGGGGTGTWAMAIYSRSNATAVDVATSVVRSNLATQRGRRQRPGVA